MLEKHPEYTPAQVKQYLLNKATDGKINMASVSGDIGANKLLYIGEGTKTYANAHTLDLSSLIPPHGYKHTNIPTYIHTHMYTHTYTHANTHMCMHIHKHTCITTYT